ncbi:MAG: hypothetical protein A2099_05785 [Planctomycetes bacterium GWF2_39_10]|nr:MAG: hypothetical protein A2099_05785 [Planctomycetes bacterium GWF2_39_10]
MTEEKNSQLIDAFESYEWIILHTNPLHYEIDLSFTPVPSYIRKDVDLHKQKEWLFDKNKTPRDILIHESINSLLSELVKKGIPLYKVDNKEITCVADIKRLWQETELDKHYYFFTELSYTSKVLQARLTSQRLKIEKELMLKLDIEKKSETTGKKIPRGQKKPYADQNEFNDFMKKIIEKDTSLSYGQIAKKHVKG